MLEHPNSSSLSAETPLHAGNTKFQPSRGLKVTLFCGILFILIGSCWAIAESIEGILSLHKTYRAKSLGWRVPFSGALSWGLAMSIAAAASLSAYSLWGLISGRVAAIRGKLVFLAICSACVVIANEVIGWQIWSHSEIGGSLRRGPYYAHFVQYEMFLLYAGIVLVALHMLIVQGRIRLDTTKKPMKPEPQNLAESESSVKAKTIDDETPKDGRHPVLRVVLHSLAIVVVLLLILISKESGIVGFVHNGLSHLPRAMHAIVYGILFSTYVLVIHSIWRFIVRAGRKKR